MENARPSLLLQMALYFNSYIAPFWLLTHLCSLSIKMDRLSNINSFLAVTSLSILIVIEAPRLYLGFVGNLFGKIPQLLGFWLVTFLIQLPVQCFLLAYKGVHLLSIEVAVDSIISVFIIIEVTSGFFAVKRAIKSATEGSQGEGQQKLLKY